MTSAEDPGWGSTAKGLLFAFVPTLGARMAMRSANALILMRQAWVGFAAMACLIWVSVLLLWAFGGLPVGYDGRVVAIGVLVAGVALQLLAGVVVPGLSGADADAVRGNAQKRFFLRVAFAEAAALIGFVGFVFTMNPGVYLAGFVPAMAGLFDAVPNAANLERMQHDLNASGSNVDVLAALVSGGVTR